MEHVHGPNCECVEYVDAEKSNDLLPAIDVDKIRCLNVNLFTSMFEIYLLLSFQKQTDTFVFMKLLLFIIHFFWKFKTILFLNKISF